MTALLRTARILRRVLETWGDCSHSDSSEELSANTDVKNSIRDEIITIKDLTVINQKTKICQIVDFGVQAYHGIKLKEWEQDLARDVRKIWNLKVTIISIVIVTFSTVTKGLLKGLEDSEVGRRVETI